MRRNQSFDKLSPSYLFPEVARRVREFRLRNKDAKLLHLGVGDTSLPLPKLIAGSLSSKAANLGTPSGYSGYGPEEGERALREKIASTLYTSISADEVTISDGANCDISRLQVLFGRGLKVAVPDPTYPVYLDSTRLMEEENLVFLPIGPENNFFPDLDRTPPVDLIFFCSPNNPTGTASSYAELKKLVAFAKAHRAIIIFDAAYSAFVTDPNTPRSIYDIEGAKEVAIEVGSFSKRVGFSGVRLGWTVVPKELCYDDGKQVLPDWMRIVTTLFNGASNIAQAGGLSALSPEGLKETELLISYYLENARLLKQGLQNIGYTVYGGEQIPYLWVDCKTESWSLFDLLLNEKQIVTTPGSGYGKAGEGFLRFSAFGKRQDLIEAIERLSCN